MTLQIVASLIDAARGVIYDRHMFIVQATDSIHCFSKREKKMLNQQFFLNKAIFDANVQKKTQIIILVIKIGRHDNWPIILFPNGSKSTWLGQGA